MNIKCVNIIINKLYCIFAAIFIKIKHVNPIETGKITDNLFVIKTATANFYIYKSGDAIISFDSGFGKNLICSELSKLGIDPMSITHLFLTHSDFDHASGVAVFKKAKIYLSSDEEQMITRKTARMHRYIFNSRIKRPYNLLKDNDIITVGSAKVKAISTPGHTPGSMSYLINDCILIVGDSFRLLDGKVCELMYYNMDIEKHRESIKKLACLENVELACTAHRGYTEKFDEAIRHWK